MDKETIQKGLVYKTNKGFVLFKGIINTIVRLMPLALQMGCVMSALIFKNKKAAWLLLGFVIIEIISFGFIVFNITIPNPACALVKSGDKQFSMPAPVPLSIGFFCGFLIAEMFKNNKFEPFKFYGLCVFLIIVIWSRINVGCHSPVESIFAAIIGLLFGVGYYYSIKKKYNDELDDEEEDEDDKKNNEDDDLILYF